MSTAVSSEETKKGEESVTDLKPFALLFAEKPISPQFPCGMSPTQYIGTPDGKGGWDNDD